MNEATDEVCSVKAKVKRGLQIEVGYECQGKTGAVESQAIECGYWEVVCARPLFP